MYKPFFGIISIGGEYLLVNWLNFSGNHFEIQSHNFFAGFMHEPYLGG